MAGQDFCLRAVSSWAKGQRPPWRWAGLAFVVAAEITSIMHKKSINTTTKLSKKESGGIILKTLCSAPSVIIATQAKMAQVMVGIPIIRKRTKSFPFTLNTPSLDSKRA